jgi:citrate synthase
LIIQINIAGAISMTDYLSAEEAAGRLGVSRQTLYAYVSRGLLRAHATDDRRRSRYLRDDVERLAGARRRGRRPKEVARSTLDWGLPVLESAITLIRGGRLYYRGFDVLALAEEAEVERVAEILWEVPPGEAFAVPPPALPALPAVIAAQYADVPPSESLLPLFALLSTDEASAVWQQDSRRRHEGCGAVLRTLLACSTGRPAAAGPLHRQLADAWGLEVEGADLLRRALVLCADHELNASGFTARCIASTGASLRAAVIGGLAALSGVRHGAATSRVETFWSSLGTDALAGHLRRRLAAGEEVPGLGHPLYPQGDIRARALLERILPRFPEAASLLAAVEQLTGQRPNIDFALVVLRRFLRLPEGAAFTLFALGRSIGWIAHALEQRAQGQLIRPRAVYVGLAPDGER